MSGYGNHWVWDVKAASRNTTVPPFPCRTQWFPYLSDLKS